MHEVKRLACFASEYENDFVKAMIERSAKVAENTTLRKQRELDMPFERRYEDNASGKIDDVRFAKMSKRYEQEQSENAKKIKALWLELKRTKASAWTLAIFLKRCGGNRCDHHYKAHGRRADRPHRGVPR